ncbi:NAD(P)/FAD-dependent oxidoreductase [Andreprevotia chitinilytica]|uniref:NAD(P)/FAD-dependent oxidoreductase n=1 Tax=Andreprevotia chitinilytica TaxID=396808 RepID=UPI000690933E|nr:FAD-dependent oxidoreductase [Andreprevotia chitinilytica]
MKSPRGYWWTTASTTRRTARPVIIATSPAPSPASIAPIAPSLSGPDGSIVCSERTVPYDLLVLALGSITNDFGTPGVAQHCHTLNDADGAQALNRTLITRAMAVELGTQARLSIAIVGGGATGVELAAEIHHVIGELRHYGAKVVGEQLDIAVIDAADRLLSTGTAEMSARAAQTREQRGVRVILNRRVTEAREDVLVFDNGDTLAADIKVWASGIKGASACITDALPAGKRGQFPADATLRSIDDPNIFLLGDCAGCTDANGHPVPSTAQAARQQAITLAASIGLLLVGKPPLPFVYRDRGTLVSLGKAKAVGSVAAFWRADRVHAVDGAAAKGMYASLYRLHQAAVLGWPRTLAVIAADTVSRAAKPSVKFY